MVKQEVFNFIIRAVIRIVFFGIVCAAVLSAVGIANAEEARLYSFCEHEAYVNIRSRPSTSAEVTGRFWFGDSIPWDGDISTDKYGRIWYHTTEGVESGNDNWVCGDYISLEELDMREHHAQIQANGRVAARKAPSETSERKRWVEPYTMVKVYAKNDVWAVTDLGYIKTTYLWKMSDYKEE